MSNRYVIEALLRPAVELNTAVVAAVAAFVCVSAPWAVALAPSVSYVTAAAFGFLAVIRTVQGIKVIRYRRNLIRLPRYVMLTEQERVRLEAIAAMPDEQIDYSDAPYLPDAIWMKAAAQLPHTKKQITLRIDTGVLEFFKNTGKRYQSRMNAVLRAYVEANKVHPK